MSIKLIKYLAVIFYFLILVAFLVLGLLQIRGSSSLSFTPLIYWLVLLGWVATVWSFRLESRISLGLAFVLFIISSILIIFTLQDFGETVMRVSFVGWIVGVVQAVVEYKNKKPTK